jgi:hypothetical protein
MAEDDTKDLTTEKKREGQAQPISDSAGETEEIGCQEGDEEDDEEGSRELTDAD